MRKITAIAGAAALVLMQPAAHAVTSLISNGSFETPVVSGNYATYGAGSYLGAWLVGGDSVDLIRGYWQAADGAQSLDLNGNGAGSISQTFATVIGQQYTVTFSLAGNPDNSPNKTIDAGVTSNLVYTFNAAGRSSSNMGWTTESFNFTATSTASTLYFQGQSGNGAWGAALDNISVTAAVPEPGTYAMLAAGLGLLGAVSRRHAKKSAARPSPNPV